MKTHYIMHIIFNEPTNIYLNEQFPQWAAWQNLMTINQFLVIVFKTGLILIIQYIHSYIWIINKLA